MIRNSATDGDPHLPGHRRPADHRREGARGAADHDVLGRPALQPDRVHEHIERHGHGQKRCRQPVEREAHDHDRQDRERQAEGLGLLRLDAPGRGRPPPGARHQAVDVGIVAVVDRRGGPGRDGDAQDRHRHQQRMQAAGRQKHPHRGREHHQRHHVGLEQHPVVADLGNVRACRLQLQRDRLVLHSALLDLRQLVEGVERRRRRHRPLQRRGTLAPGVGGAWLA